VSTSAWLLGALTVVLGAALSLAGEWVRRRWHRDDAVIERRLDRSEAAAREALVLIGAVEERLRRCRSVREVPNQREMEVMTRPMRDAALLIGDSEVRARLESIATVAEQLHGVEAIGGYEPHRIAAAIGAAGRNVAAHVLSGEPLTDPSPITKYMQMVEEYWRWMEEVNVENRVEHSESES
jgi:hypothetical protein